MTKIFKWRTDWWLPVLRDRVGGHRRGLCKVIKGQKGQEMEACGSAMFCLCCGGGYVNIQCDKIL